MTASAGKATLRVNATECEVDLVELTIERFIAEARSVGLTEFNVYCNDELVSSPAALELIDGATYVVAPLEKDFKIEID